MTADQWHERRFVERWQPADLDRFRQAGVRIDRPVDALIRARMAASPQRLALRSETAEWTNADVVLRERVIAAWLLQAGVGPGDVVVWQVPNIAEVVPLFLACWRVGAVAAPIVGIYRELEVAGILADLRPTAVVTVSENRGFGHAEMFDDCLAEDPATVPRLLLRGTRRGWDSLDSMTAEAVDYDSVLTPDAPCLILQTSGSTGRSKAVVHSSRSLVAEALHATRSLGWRASSVSYVATSTAHVAGLLRGLVLPLAAGGSIVMRTHWDAERAANDVASQGVNFLSVPSLLLDEFIDAYHGLGNPSHDVTSIVAMAAAKPEAFREADRLGFAPVSNYGLSELPTATDPRPDFALERRIATVGPPSPGVEAKILGTDGVDGRVGELWLRGPEQMVGYLDAAQDAAAWTDDNWLRTGDLAQIVEGDIVIVGRVKDTISRGGEKFSSEQIESVIRSHPSVRDVAVVGGPDPRLGEVPVAFVTVVESFDEEALRSHLRGAGLAAQKVPVMWTVVDELPRTASGRIAKGALRERLQGSPAT